MLPRPPAISLLHAMARRGDFAGVARLAQPWATRPDASAELVSTWADALLELGQTPLALQVWQQLAQMAPGARSWTGLGRALTASGRPQEALPLLTRALSQPGTRAVDALCDAAVAAQDHPLVIQTLQVARRMRPKELRIGLTLARELEAHGALQHAATVLQQLQLTHPMHPEPPLRLATVWATTGHMEEALERAEHACTLLPDHTEPRRVAAHIARKSGLMDRAAQHLDHALELDPEHPGLHWARAVLMPAIPDTPEAQAQAQAHYDQALEALHDLADRTLAARSGQWLHAIHDAFQIHYGGGDCLRRQARHGQLIERIVATALPVPRVDPPPRGRLRVGFISSMFRRHTVTKLFQGWMTQLDRDHFEVIGYHMGVIEDDTTRALQASCDQWRSIHASLDGAIRTIEQDAPDALIFPELGMDARVLTLAGVRLAPKQAVAWGHPITPGLSTIDAFLACEAMAVSPDRTWTLAPRLDLPGIGVHYARPERAATRTRADLGLPLDRTLLLCVQSLQKYRPAHDALYARIAASVPEACLVFVDDPRASRTDRLRRRFHRAFADRDLDLDAHLVFLPRLTEPDWMSLLALGDLFLDSPEWSGGNTTLEALSEGLPCLAWPGSTFRGRHCHGINQVLGLDELCPPDSEAWVQQAITLARAPEQRAALRARIQASVPNLFRDDRSTQALATWLRCSP